MGSGENVLHMAIVNEDPGMTKYLLDHGAAYNQRCFGNFMSPEDQKPSRTDTMDSDIVAINNATDYEGYYIIHIHFINFIHSPETSHTWPERV